MKSGSLIFAWPSRHRIHLALPATVFLAAIAHASIFFLFSIIYPAEKKEGLKPAQVYFIPTGTEGHTQIEGLLHSSDPSLFAPGQGLQRVEESYFATYTPQYATGEPALISPPLQKTISTDAPKAIQEGPVKIPRPSNPSPSSSQQSRRTTLKTSGSLASRLPEVSQNAFSSSKTFSPLNPAVFLVGVDETGKVAHITLQQSSGDETLDRATLIFLQSAQFAPNAESPIEWDFVEFLWGSELKNRQEP